MRIYLDMDGVLCDFVSAACEIHGRKGYDVTHWNFYKDWGMTDEEFWKPIHEAGEEWWANLPAYPWCDELLKVVGGFDAEFVICTSPSRSPSSLAGKLRWLQAKLGPKFGRYIMTQDKSPLAAADAVLIDDSDSNCDKFTAGGGCAIRFPQKWNKMARAEGRGVEFVKFCFEYWAPVILKFPGLAESSDAPVEDTAAKPPETPAAQLPADAAARKATPIATGVLDYFPLALAEVARVSKAGNDQHNPGQPLHWDKSKSLDHADCIVRHLIDRGTFDSDRQRHSAKVAWRALALLQTELELSLGA